jgi:uncharacterized cupin superfamily protein
MSLTAFRLDADREDLTPWGRPEDIGAETLEGDVRVAGSFSLGTPDAPVFGGLYSATCGRYRVVYAFHEHATLLYGALSLTDERTGETQLFGPGDSWIIAKGTPVVWDIRSDSICKSYVAATTDVQG